MLKQLLVQLMNWINCIEEELDRIEQDDNN